MFLPNEAPAETFSANPNQRNKRCGTHEETQVFIQCVVKFFRQQRRSVRRRRNAGAGGGARLGRAVLFSWFLFGRFFAQRVGGFFFARRGGDKLYAARGRFALALADVIEEPLQVVTGFVREVVARLADFSQDFIHGLR